MPAKRPPILPKQPRRSDFDESEFSDAALQRARLRLLMLPHSEATRNERARAITHLASIYWRRQQFDEAIMLWQQLIEQAKQGNDPAILAMCYAALATTYAHKGDYDAAILNGKRALVYDPNSPAVVLMLGNAFDAKGDDASAFLWWRRLLKMHPDFQQTYEYLGSLHFRRGEFVEAERFLLKALEMEPESDTCLNELGNMYITMERFEDALPLFKKAQQLYPESGSAVNNMGNCYLKMGRFEEARSAFEKRVQMRPSDALAANIGLGLIYRLRSDEGAVVKSKEHFQSALAIYATRAAMLLTRRIEHEARRALCLVGLGDLSCVDVWREILAHPETRHVGVGPKKDWRLSVALLQEAPEPPWGVDEVAALLAEHSSGKP
jgi:tetratricopeptide (TPR) repeat protein